MDTSSLVVAVIGGGTIGAAFTALLTTAHERVERRRDRMFDAAESFISACEELLDVCSILRQRHREFNEGVKMYEEASASARERINELREGDVDDSETEKPLDPALEAVALGMSRLNDVVSYLVAGSYEVDAVKDALTDLDEAIKAVSTYSGENREIVSELRAVMFQGRRFYDPCVRLVESILRGNASLRQKDSRFARLLIFYSKNGSSVIAAAIEVDACINRVWSATDNDSPDSASVFESARSDTSRAFVVFARAVSDRTNRWFV